MPGLSTRRLLLSSFVVMGLLHLESGAQTAHDLDCCYNYTKRPLKLKMIVNYTNQSSSDVCDRDAVIFHTIKRFNVCAHPDEAWVKKIVNALRRRNKQGQKKRVTRKNRTRGKPKQR